MKIHAKKLLNKSPLEIKANMRGNGFEVIFEDGTYAEIKNKNTGAIWGVNASGDGDFTHHKVEFEFVH